jgi:hypothetical protein
VWSIVTPGSPVTIVGSNTGPSVVVTSPVCTEFNIRLEVTAPDGFVTICETTNAFVDTTPPVLSNLPVGRDLGCNPTLPTCATNVIALDNCDGDISARVVCIPGNIVETGTCTRSQIFAYSVIDSCGNVTVSDVNFTWKTDTTAPVLGNLPTGGDLGCNPVRPSCSAEVTASDRCDGDLTARVVCVPGELIRNGDCSYRQNFTYTVRDDCNNAVTAVVTYVWREDTIPPVLSNIPVGGDLGCNPTRPSCSTNVTAIDNCDGDISARVICTPGPIVAAELCRKVQLFTYSIVDGCENTAQAVVRYTWVEDTLPPVIVCPTVTSPIECPAVPVFPEARVSDDCDPATRLTFEDVTVPGACPQSYSVTRTWTAIDACGNRSTCSVAIAVVDTTAPRIVCPRVESPIECPAVPVFPEATASDDCDPTPRLVFRDVTVAGQCPQSYSVTRIWTATDACGNSSTCSSTIEVRDTTPPLVTWPGDINLTCTDCDIDPANTGSPTGEDLCGTLTITYTDSITGTCPKRVERQWTISDGCNEVSHVQIIQCLPTTRVVVTDSSLCSYDLDPTTPCKDFRLLFTQDAQNFPQYKLHASNPGQTYFNLFYTGLPGAVVTLNLTIPYPYVTQGAQPIHAYDSVTAIPGLNGQECYIPGNGFFVNSTQVVLSDYLPQGMGSSTTVTVTLTVPATGFVYLNMHLDYGLKKTTGYAKGGPSGNDAIDPTTLRVLIPDRGTYSFAFSDGNEAASDSLCNINVFKKVPGVGVMSTQRTTTYDGLPTTRQFEGCGVVLKDSKGLTLATGKTDLDGWAFCNYKWTGKSTTVYVTLTPPGRAPQTQPVTLKANGYAQVDFESP